MTKNELIENIGKLGRQNGSFVGFETITYPHLKKTSRKSGEPFKGVVSCRSKFSAMLGVSYQNAVNNQNERNGEARDFVPQKPFGKHFVEINGVMSKWLMKHDTEEKYYVALDKVGGSVKDYYIDGRKATDEEVADLKENYFDKPSKSKIAGLWRTYGVESIVAVS